MSSLAKKDWKNLARASGWPIPDAELDRMAQTLNALEASFRPLAEALRPETEPALIFRPDLPESEEDAG